jgi:Uma2 family endonuclease
MTAIPKPQKHTVEEYLKLTEHMEERTELLDGEIVAMSSPSRTHQRISYGLHRVIDDYIHANGGDCEVDEALNAFLSEHDVPIPDVMVVCDPSKLDESGCHGAPDWVIEVTSSNRSDDFDRKFRLYKNAGVREYWIVDTDDHKVYVYNFDQHPNVVEFYDWTDEIPVGIYDGKLVIRIADLV